MLKQNIRLKWSVAMVWNLMYLFGSSWKCWCKVPNTGKTCIKEECYRRVIVIKFPTFQLQYFERMASRNEAVRNQSCPRSIIDFSRSPQFNHSSTGCRQPGESAHWWTISFEEPQTQKSWGYFDDQQFGIFEVKTFNSFWPNIRYTPKEDPGKEKVRKWWYVSWILNTGVHWKCIKAASSLK